MSANPARNKQVHTFLSQEEKDALSAMAELRGLKMSAYIRSLLLADLRKTFSGDLAYLSDPRLRYDAGGAVCETAGSGADGVGGSVHPLSDVSLPKEPLAS